MKCNKENHNKIWYAYAYIEDKHVNKLYIWLYADYITYTNKISIFDRYIDIILQIYFTYIYMRRAWQTTPVFLPGESHGQRGVVGYSPWGHKELDMTE